MKVRSRVTAGVLVVILIMALVPAVSAAAGPPKAARKVGVVLPAWVTAVMDQVKAVAQEAAVQLKPIYEQEMPKVRQAIADAWAQLKGVKDPAQAKAILDQLGAKLKVIYDEFVAAATPIIQAASAKIQAIIAKALLNSSGLNAQVKAKVKELLDSLRKYIPKLAF